MEEKIKIYISNRINNILKKDMELFEFFKKDGSLNRNDFLNCLIINYHEKFSEDNLKLFNLIKDRLKENNLDNTYLDDTAYKILSIVEKKHLHLDDKKKDIVISMKPTRNSTYVFDYIENCLLNGNTLSGWIRSLLASYSDLPQDVRERIIFKNNFELVDKAIKEKKKVFFTINNKDNKYIISPFKIASSKEELFNYLLGEYENESLSFRMSRLKSLTILNEPVQYADKVLINFEKMLKNGPQFAYGSDENQEIVVRLSYFGKALYRRIYLHRPAYIRCEDDLYYFDCSLNQARQYFERFGKNAIVLKPQNLKDSIETFYNQARKAYKNTL